MKICRICNETKPLTEFYTRLNNKDGLDTACKVCHRERVAINKKNSARQTNVQIPRRLIPAWLTPDDWVAIAGYYYTAKHLTQETGEAHVVDHVLPLRGTHVTGLHVPANLQVLTAKENAQKGYKFQS